MFRQLVIPVVAVLVAVAGIGGVLINTDRTHSVVADKQALTDATPSIQHHTHTDLQKTGRRLDEINQVIASRVPQLSGLRPVNANNDSQAPWHDPALNHLFQQIRDQKLTLWFPRNGEPFSIWVGNPEKIVDGKKTYQHAEALQKAVPLINQLPFPVRVWFYGTRDQSNPELGECIEAVEGIKKLTGVKFSYCRINERGYQALRKLSRLQNLEILHSHLDETALEQIAQIDGLRRLHLHFGKKKINYSVAEKVLDLPYLEDLKLCIALPSKDVTPFWMKLAGCSQLVSLEVDCGTVKQDVLVKFLKTGDHQKLNKWVIRSIFPRKKLADAFVLAPQLTSLKIPSGSTDEMLYLLEKLASDLPGMRDLTFGWDTGTHLTGEEARQALSLLGSFTNLEHCQVPITLPDAYALQPITQLKQLESFYCKNLNLNQETLLQLAKMPALKSLDVYALNFGDESAHLLPWLSHVEQIEIRDPTTLTDARLALLTKLPQLSRLKWCDIAIQKPVPLSLEAREKYPNLEFEICGN
ncbi:hypothetical protein [Gimesia algae]|uniref:Leucine Rich repeats (2 copies) n=1 Tax=Gimesia algae TaxID=2527971 RepID=A0A517VLE2_9PLAN|nr:hypothetical protein [Gimesia algae]QDT93831.1 hypothetical protein Pan161_55180 [Gimesia algae]